MYSRFNLQEIKVKLQSSSSMSLDFDDQSEEIEVLQSIFPTEFTLLSGSDEAVGHHRFKIQLEPTTIDADNHGESLSILYSY